MCAFENAPIYPPFENKRASQEQIELAAKLINESKRPYLYIGGGAVGAQVAMVFKNWRTRSMR